MELGDLLRSTRANISPERAGLPAKARRRAPGLRREEVAELADISVTWYTWLEQGRDIHVSREVLDRIADALQLDADKRRHLHVLADHELSDVHPAASETIGPALQCVFDSLQAYPAFIRGRRWDVLAWNAAASTLFGDIYTLPQGKRNVLRWAFTSPALRRISTTWEQEVRAMLALFRIDYDRYVEHGDWFEALIEELNTISPEFRQWWVQHEINRWHVPANVYVHPAVGEFSLHRVGFTPDDGAGLQLVVFAPADSNSAVRLQRLQLSWRRGPMQDLPARP
jgi:transcriptional regulator with XRE-family HTH domain